MPVNLSFKEPKWLLAHFNILEDSPLHLQTAIKTTEEGRKESEKNVHLQELEVNSCKTQSEKLA